MKPLLVGESNPYGTDPRYALYPHPERSAGGRLCWIVLGLEPRDYLLRFDRQNLCAETWSLAEARRTARLAAEGRGPADPIVLLGARVCSAFRVPYAPFTADRYALRILDGAEKTLVILPHPSGRCLTWNDPTSFERARAVLRAARVLPTEVAA